MRDGKGMMGLVVTRSIDAIVLQESRGRIARSRRWMSNRSMEEGLSRDWVSEVVSLTKFVEFCPFLNLEIHSERDRVESGGSRLCGHAAMYISITKQSVFWLYTEQPRQNNQDRRI